MTNIIQTMNETDILNGDVRFFLENHIEYIELLNKIETAISESEEIVVVTSNDVSVAAEYISNFKKISKNLEDVRKKLVQPLIDKKYEIDQFFKQIPVKYEKEIFRLEKELIDFKVKETNEARRKAEEERKRLEEEAIELAIIEEEKRIKEAKEKGIPIESLPKVEPAIVAEVITENLKISQLNSSGIKTRRTKTFRIINPDLVPREYLEIDEKKIKAERSKYDFDALSVIPGIEFTFYEAVG